MSIKCDKDVFPYRPKNDPIKNSKVTQSYKDPLKKNTLNTSKKM